MWAFMVLILLSRLRQYFEEQIKHVQQTSTCVRQS